MRPSTHASPARMRSPWRACSPRSRTPSRSPTQARELAERALELDATQSEARVALGYLHLNNAEGTAAAVQLKRALATAPNSVEALEVVGRVLIEVGRVKLGLATLRRALAIEPSLSHSRQSIARSYALLGDLDAMRDAIGPVPADPSELTPHLIMRARFAMWRGDVAEAEAVALEFERHPEASPVLKQNALVMAGITKAPTLGAAALRDLDERLALDKRFAPRRISFHAQLRVEMKLACNELDAALEDLRIADANGLLDLLWLDRCPLLERVRGRPELDIVRESTSARADRIIRILAP